MARGELTETIGPLGPPEPPTPPLAPGTTVAERYEVRKVLGHGGHAVVYLAFDQLLEQDVALKVLRADRMGAVALERFRREAAVTRNTASPHLVRIFDLGTAGDTIFLTLEHVEGETLRKRLEREGALPLTDALSISRQVLEGLRSLHRAGVVHRDVKPSNILIGEECVKLADFGLAFHWNRDETRLTETLHVVGTAEYLSPEQIRGDRAGPTSDLFSLGVVLFEMLTGDLPHQRGSSLPTLLTRLRERPADPRTLRPEVPSWLARLVACLLEKRPADRPPSGEAALAALEKHRSPRFGRRRRRRLATGALLSLLVGVSAFGGWQGLRKPSAGHRFSHFQAIDGVEGLQAVGDDGTVLWKRPEARATDFVAFHIGPERRLLIAGTEKTPPGPVDGEKGKGDEKDDALHLVLLDPDTGDLVRDVPLPLWTQRFFPNFGDDFGTFLSAQDLDGDGGDEIVIHFMHRYWPSFTVLYEPAADYVRTLFAAAGHHRLAGLADVDGDGADEALFVGTSNRLGHYYALAAVRIDPPVGTPPVNRLATGPKAFTPDPYLAGAYNTDLVWYALLPTSACSYPECVEVDEPTRTIRISRPNRKALVLDFDGFLADRPAAFTAAERQRARTATFSLLSEAERLILGDFRTEALSLVADAQSEARRAEDPWLTEWAARSASQVLIRAGRRQEGEERARALMRESEMEPEIAYEIARTLQLCGWPRRAISWFHKGLGIDPTPVRGRNLYEIVEGLMLVHAELRDWSGAREALRELVGDRSRRLVSVAPYLGFILWHAGERPERLNPSPSAPDPDRYWALEIRLLYGDPLPELLKETREALRTSWETVPLLTSLEGEILVRMGRSDEALDAARKAFEAASLEVKTSPLARAHLPLITERLTRLLRERALYDEAARVTNETAQMLRRQE